MFEFDIYFYWKHDIFVKNETHFSWKFTPNLLFSTTSAIVNGVGGAYKTVRLAER